MPSAFSLDMHPAWTTEQAGAIRPAAIERGSHRRIGFLLMLVSSAVSVHALVWLGRLVAGLTGL